MTATPIRKLQDRVSVYQLKLLKHALGLNNAKRPYRNYFSASLGHSDLADWKYLVEIGMAKEHPTEYTTTFVFVVTDEGKRLVRFSP